MQAEIMFKTGSSKMTLHVEFDTTIWRLQIDDNGGMLPTY